MKIRIALDEVIRAGGHTVAAVTKSWSQSCESSRAFSVHGAKWPIAILTRRDEVTAAFEMDGHPIEPDDFERRFPGLRAAFEAARPSR